jgi:hypothetical protein
LFSRQKDSTRWRLKPAPKIPASYTLGQVEAVCALLDLDVDLLIAGDITAEDWRLPKVARAPELLRILCENGDKYDVADWTPGQYEGVFIALLGHFLLRLAIS